MSSSLHKLEVFPDVVDPFDPSIELHVEYEVGAVHDGNELSPKDTKNEPKVHYSGTPGEFYTLAMVDPDAPSRKEPRYREWRHWIVINIPGSDVAGGGAMSNYMGPGPPKGTGLHRYVFILYKQPGKLVIQHLPDDGMNRASFKVREFAQKFRLAPVGITFFQAQNK